MTDEEVAAVPNRVLAPGAKPKRPERPSETARRLAREEKKKEREATAAAGAKKPRRKMRRSKVVRRRKRDEVESVILELLKIYRMMKDKRR